MVTAKLCYFCSTLATIGVDVYNKYLKTVHEKKVFTARIWGPSIETSESLEDSPMAMIDVF